MVVHLHSLLSLRRRAEDAAGQALAHAIALRKQQEQRQEALVEAWRAARQRLDGGRKRPVPPPTTAAQSLARDLYRQRLEASLTRTAECAARHGSGPLAMAIRSEETARLAFAKARAQRKAVENRQATKQTEARQIAHRRAEDAASDLAQAACLRRRNSASPVDR